LLSHSSKELNNECFVQYSISGQICDLAEKLESWDQNTIRGSFGSIGHEGSGGSIDKKTEDKLSKATKDSCKITTEVLHGIMTQVGTVLSFLNKDLNDSH